MVNFKKALEGIIDTSRRKALPKKKKEAKEPVKILLLSRHSDIPKILKLAHFCPILFLYIKEYKEKNNGSLKKSLLKLRDDGEPEGIHSKLLDENWVVVLNKNTTLVG